MALTLSRVDRTPRTYVLADVMAVVPASVDGVQVALLPPRSGPTAATVWTTVTYASGSFDVLWVGPDADASGGLVVPASADAWVKVTDAPLVEAVKLERITVLGGGAILTAPLGVPVVSVNGKQGSAVVLSAADVGAQSAATLAADAATHVADGSALDVALRAGFVTHLGPPLGTDDTTWLNAVLAAGGRVIGKPGAIYLISAPLVLKSGTTLDMTGCTVQLKAGSNCNMVNNAAVTAARTVMDAAITAATATLTSATAAFVSGDVGKTVWVYGAGPGGTILKTTISSVTNGTTAVLAANAATTVATKAASIGPRDSDVTIIGGVWDRQSNTGAAPNGNTFRFRRADNVKVIDVKVISGPVAGGLKYAINFGDCTDLTAERLTFDYSSDGVHLNGPIRGGTIRALRGYTRDDMVSLTPNDWTGSNDVYGDIEDVVIDDIRPRLTDNCAVKVLGGSATPLTAARNIKVSNVSGYTTKAAQAFGGLVYVGDDTGQPSTTGGYVEDVSIRTVSGVVPNDHPLIHISGKNIGQVDVDGVHADVPNATAAVIRCQVPTGGVINALHVRNIRVTRLGISNVVEVSGNSPLGRLTVDGITVESWAGSTSAALIYWSFSQTGTASVSRVNVVASTGGTVMYTDSAPTSLLFDRIELANSANNIGVLRVGQASVLPDVVVSRLTAAATGGYAVNLSSLNCGISRLKFSDITWSGGGGLVQTTANAGHTFPTVLAQNCTVTNATWALGDIASTTTVRLANFVATPSANIANLRATAQLTVFAENTDVNGKTFQGTAGYTVASRALGLRLDVSILNSKTKGDLAYNTNAALSCGVGPVVYTGTAWKSLIDGTTY